MDDGDDLILSQIAANLETEFWELKALNDSDENIQISQAVDLLEMDFLDMPLGDISFDIGFNINTFLSEDEKANVGSATEAIPAAVPGIESSTDDVKAQPDNTRVKSDNASRFAPPVTENKIEQLNKSKKKRNTLKSNTWSVNIFESWRNARMDTIPDLLSMDKSAMSYWLQRFILEIRTQKGTEYTGKSVYAIICGLLRHLRENKIYDKNLLDEKDPEFAEFRQTLDSLMKDLLERGIGTEPRQADPLSFDDENKLWEQEVFGMKDSQTLQYTVFFYSCKRFGLRGRDEHKNLDCSQFNVGRDSSGRYIRFEGRNCKTFKGGLGQMGLTNKDIKHYCEDGPRCLATFFELYLQALGNEGRFYRRSLDGESVRYSDQQVGVNKLDKFMKRIAELGDIKGNFTNHSGKRTCASSLYDANIDEQEIMSRTGHRSVNAVRKYKRPSDSVRKRTSTVLNPVSETSVSERENCEQNVSKFSKIENLEKADLKSIQQNVQLVSDGILNDISSIHGTKSQTGSKENEEPDTTAFLKDFTSTSRNVQFTGCTFNF